MLRNLTAAALLPLALLAAAPVTVDTNPLAVDDGRDLQLLEADRQLGARNLAFSKPQRSVDLRLLQRARDLAIAVQLSVESFDLRNKRLDNRQIEVA